MATALAAMAGHVGAVESSAAEPVKIGVAGAHSGDLASYGIPTVRAAELVVNDVNSR